MSMVLVLGGLLLVVALGVALVARAAIALPDRRVLRVFADLAAHHGLDLDDRARHASWALPRLDGTVEGVPLSVQSRVNARVRPFEPYTLVEASVAPRVRGVLGADGPAPEGTQPLTLPDPATGEAVPARVDDPGALEAALDGPARAAMAVLIATGGGPLLLEADGVRCTTPRPRTADDDLRLRAAVAAVLAVARALG